MLWKLNFSQMSRGFLWALLLLLESASSLSLAPHHHNHRKCNRRTILESIVAVPAITSILTSHPLVAASAATHANNVFTLVIDSPDTSNIGIDFVDRALDGKEFASVGNVTPDSVAAAIGIRQGMVLLTRNSATKSSSKNIQFRLDNGPYPFVLQFTTAEEATTISNMGQQETNESTLGPYDRLAVQVVQKPDNCNVKAKPGDVVTISYEARISSMRGPIYDSTSWRQGEPATFQLGKRAALPGVEIGLQNMCVGEVRQIDVPTTLGYGKFGSQVFDIPGDVRLWWRVELLNLTKSAKKYSLF